MQESFLDEFRRPQPCRKCQERPHITFGPPGLYANLHE
jgi:hypothetical protein